MGPKRILGLLALVAGVALLVIGLNASHSIADQVSNTFAGRFTQTTIWYIVGGLAIAVVGLFLLIAGRK